MKILIKFLTLILILIFTFLFYLSFFGVETKVFNKIIQNKIKSIDPNLILLFSKTKIVLDIRAAQLKIRFVDSKFGVSNNKILLNKLNSSISIKSILEKKFPLKNVEVDIKNTEILKIIDISSKIKKNIGTLFLKQFINSGKLNSEISINFDSNGKIKDDFKIKASVISADINFLDDYKFKKINADINISKNLYKINFNNIIYSGIDFSSSVMELRGDKNSLILKGKLISRAKNLEEKNISNIFNFIFKDFKQNISNLSFDLTSEINVKLKNYFKVIDYSVKTNGNIDSLQINNSKKIIKLFNNLNNKFIFKNSKVSFQLTKDQINFETQSLVNFSDKFEKFYLKTNYNKKNKKFNFLTEADIDHLSFDINFLTYMKKNTNKAKIKFSGFVDIKKKINLKYFNYQESKNKIQFKNVKLSKNFKINSFSNLLIKTHLNNKTNNNFSIKLVNNELNVQGKIYDGRYFFSNIFENNKDKIINENFNAKLFINIDEVIADKDNLLHNFSTIGKIKKGEIFKLVAKAKFSENEFIDITIDTSQTNKKNIILYSDRASPLIRGLKFINGFEGGKLEYKSIIDKKESSSKLKIKDFKLQDVPLLTKLLTLGSLQGIADLLTGEGIRFTELEADFNSNNNLISLKEMYAIGPAISLLMEGYIEKNKLVSLRGTLVPATTLNKMIGNIPILGELLIGKKTGEGVFGVSFKIKGSPRDLKTTVNPIKTLTPRFITRTLEKIKKN